MDKRSRNTRKRKKKQAAMLLFMVLLIIVGGAAIFMISQREKEDTTPAKRYQEKKQEMAENEEKQDTNDGIEEDSTEEDSEEKNSVMLSPLKVEVLSYEVIDGNEINKQTTYLPEYFYENKLPDPEVYEEQTDFEACKAECPELKDIWENNENYSVQEVKDIYQEHIDVIQKHTTKVLVPRHFVFVKCKITNTSKRNHQTYLNDIDVCPSSKDNSVYSLRNDTLEYFDKPTYVEGEDRMHSYFLHSFKPNETFECTLGFEVEDKGIEDPDYYLGIMDIQMQDDNTHPSYSNHFIKLNDLEGAVK